jgi:hypothetical protein
VRKGHDVVDVIARELEELALEDEAELVLTLRAHTCVHTAFPPEELDHAQHVHRLRDRRHADIRLLTASDIRVPVTANLRVRRTFFILATCNVWIFFARYPGNGKRATMTASPTKELHPKK